MAKISTVDHSCLSIPAQNGPHGNSTTGVRHGTGCVVRVQMQPTLAEAVRIAMDPHDGNTPPAIQERGYGAGAVRDFVTAATPRAGIRRARVRRMG